MMIISRLTRAQRSGSRTAAKQKMRRLKSRAGYTLLEIMIVITIIGLLITVVGVGLKGMLDNSKVNVAKIGIRNLKASMETLNLNIGRYPTQAEGLDILVTDPGDAAPGWAGPYLDKDVLPLDPWGHPFRYYAPSGDEQPKIGSLGSDGQEGGTKLATDIIL
jgi:general secretion pathway protein G